MSGSDTYDIIVVGGGHAGVEAAWAAANLGARVALVTLDPAKIGAMSCNPAIGGLAKGQIVREIDALGGLMGLAADATGLQFRVLNSSKGQAVRGPRCQSDKYRYARRVQQLIATRANISVLGGTVESVLVKDGRVRGVTVGPTQRPTGVRRQDGALPSADGVDERILTGSPYDALDSPAVRIEAPATLLAHAVVVTTGTFMRGLMHTGEYQAEGGRLGEAPAVGISASLRELGFDLGRLKTGTPPRVDGATLDFDRMDPQPGDARPTPFSDMTGTGYRFACDRFPAIEQKSCWITQTNEAIHQMIRDNLDRAPLYNGQIESNVGPRYCPSIEDKVVRFKEKNSHHVFLEPESLDTNEVYCNGIPTSLPADVQDFMVASIPGMSRARILRYGYAVEYDMVWPHQVDATCMTKRVAGLFLAGQINGTSGYEEAGGQGLLAGLNAVRYLGSDELVRLRRDQAYIGVLMDDLVTKTPREPYRMFTSRAEFRLMLRADNAMTRLTPLGRQWGLVDDERWAAYEHQVRGEATLRAWLSDRARDGRKLIEWLRRPEVDVDWVLAEIDRQPLDGDCRDRAMIERLLAEMKYEGYIARQETEIARQREQEASQIPAGFDYGRVDGLRTEARLVLEKFRPATMGQAARLAGVNPADLMLVSLAVDRWQERNRVA